MQHMNRKVTFGGIVLSCMMLLMSSIVSASVGPQTSYVGSNDDYSVVVPVVKPAWTLPIDKPSTNDDVSNGIWIDSRVDAYLDRRLQRMA